MEKTIKISLTDFIDFVNKSGNSKLTKVRQIKQRKPYHPSTDFYKDLREGIIANHEEAGNKSSLDNILKELTNEKKTSNYEAALLGYKKFWGNKKLVWFTPASTNWKINDVEVKINPELGLMRNNIPLVVKLYLKSEKLTKDKVSQILTLLEIQLRKKVPSDCLFGILDVKNSKLFLNETKDTSFLPLLEGEIRSFETIWKAIK